jgi:hypothetical protein
MAAHDRIRLTGQLREGPAPAGLSYGATRVRATSSRSSAYFVYGWTVRVQAIVAIPLSATTMLPSPMWRRRVNRRNGPIVPSDHRPARDSRV